MGLLFHLHSYFLTIIFFATSSSLAIFEPLSAHAFGSSVSYPPLTFSSTLNSKFNHRVSFLEQNSLSYAKDQSFIGRLSTLRAGGDNGKADGGKVLEATTEEELEEILETNKDKLVILDFSAKWCGPCKMIAPKFAEISETYAPDVVCVKIDVDVNPDSATAYEVGAMPTFIFLKKGHQVKTITGANAAKIVETIESLL